MTAVTDRSASQPPPSVKRRYPIVAAVLSLLTPGAGQLYNGQQKNAWRLIALYVGIDLVAIAVPNIVSVWAFAGILLLGSGELLLRVYAAVAAFRWSRRIGSLQLGRYQQVWLYVLLIVAPMSTEAWPVQPRMKSFDTPASSMAPTLLPDDRFVVDRGYYDRFEMQRGDVAVFKLPTDKSIDYVKRIVGLPGDRIQMRHGNLYINDQLVPRQPDAACRYDEAGRPMEQQQAYRESLPRSRNEPPVEHCIVKFGDNGMLDDTPAYVVPAGHYFAMGDNRDNSQDSRVLSAVGYIPAEDMVGRARFIFFSTKLAADPAAHWWQFWRWPFDAATAGCSAPSASA